MENEKISYHLKQIVRIVMYRTERLVIKLYKQAKTKHDRKLVRKGKLARQRLEAQR
ncbi:hypothetical protein KG091_07880 [Carnobacteriaceae bacterium zg-ZUI78]|nr:hypothetical protein [Carnobacteriaceae bacterium zg-ZUI78]